MCSWDSSDGEDGPLPLSPPLLLLIESARGFCEKHHVLFALYLPLEELEGGAVEAHHVLQEKITEHLGLQVESPLLG